jgi:hypothetical protein
LCPAVSKQLKDRGPQAVPVGRGIPQPLCTTEDDELDVFDRDRDPGVHVFVAAQLVESLVGVH